MQVNGFILDELSEKVYLNKENAESILLDAVEPDDFPAMIRGRFPIFPTLTS